MDRSIVKRSWTRLTPHICPSTAVRRQCRPAGCRKWLNQFPRQWAHLSADMFEAYRDRREAGQCLGRELKQLLQHDAPVHALPGDLVVLGLVRGGMPVADAVARALGCPCDAFVVRKVGAPHQPEFGIGAVAEGGVVVINEAAVHGVGATPQQLQDTIDSETRELQRRVQAYRGARPHLPVAGKVVVLVDDGLATGVTARAACKAIKAAGAAMTVLAVPVGAPHTVEELQQQQVADVVVCLRTPKRFRAVGAHYLDFDQTTDEVVAILRQHPHPSTHQPDPAAQVAGATAAAAAAATSEQGVGCDQLATGAGAAPGASDQTAASTHLQDASAASAAAAAIPAGPSTPTATHTSSLAAALGHSPAASPTTTAAAAAAAVPAPPPQRLRPVVGEQVVITDSELGVQLHGTLTVPEGAAGLVVFAHGSGSSRNSPRNSMVAATLQRAGLATLLFDLLSEGEAQVRHNVFDIALLASRLQLAVEWLEAEGTPAAGKLAPEFPLGFFGASTGGGAALWAAAYMGPRVSAVVVRGGRPDLAAAKLPAVCAPTLLLVGGEDRHVLELNHTALQMMGASDSSQIVVVPGAGHLFEGPGQQERVAELAVQWFRAHMGGVTDGDE